VEEFETKQQPEPAAEGAGFRVRAMRLFLGVVVLGLAAATLYLLAERNSRFYYLVQEGERLVVYRGAWLPSGKRPYLPDDAHTAAIYAPIDLPPGAGPFPERRFDERQDLDRALFAILADLAMERIRSEDEARVQEGLLLVERAGRLPGITGEQAKMLRTMHAELAFFEGRAHLERALIELRQSREKLERATEASSGRGRSSLVLLRTVVPATEALTRALHRAHGWEVPETPLPAPSMPAPETAAPTSDAVDPERPASDRVAQERPAREPDAAAEATPDEAEEEALP